MRDEVSKCVGRNFRDIRYSEGENRGCLLGVWGIRKRTEHWRLSLGGRGVVVVCYFVTVCVNSPYELRKPHFRLSCSHSRVSPNLRVRAQLSALDSNCMKIILKFQTLDITVSCIIILIFLLTILWSAEEISSSVAA